jgi:hypothetical protein
MCRQQAGYEDLMCKSTQTVTTNDAGLSAKRDGLTLASFLVTLMHCYAYILLLQVLSQQPSLTAGVGTGMQHLFLCPITHVSKIMDGIDIDWHNDSRERQLRCHFMMIGPMLHVVIIYAVTGLHSWLAGGRDKSCHGSRWVHL